LIRAQLLLVWDQLVTMSPCKLSSSMIREAQRCSCGRAFFCGAAAFPGELRANKYGDLARRLFLFCVVICNYCCVSSGVVDAKSLMQAASSARRSPYNNADSSLPPSSSSSLFRETFASVQGGGGAVSFMQNYETTADANHYRMLDGGQLVQLVLDPEGGRSSTFSPSLSLDFLSASFSPVSSIISSAIHGFICSTSLDLEDFKTLVKLSSSLCP
jgi:hypothetical protein